MNSSDWQNLCEECKLGHFTQASPVRGSASDRSWYLQTSTGAFFVKTALSRYLPLLEAEGVGLKAIAQTNTIRCPRVVSIYRGVKWAGLVLEWLILSHHETPTDAQYSDLAENLAKLHGQHAKSFGWNESNYLELSLQHNVHLSDWASFLRSQRLLPQITMARDRGLSRNTLSSIEQVMMHLDDLFASDVPGPSLVHGNFWHDNIAFLADRTPVVFKPACYYGDPLMDLARAKLSGHLPERFYQTYWQHIKHRKHEMVRLELYQLYYLLHQFNHIGSAYTQPINQLVQQIREQIDQ